MPSSHTILNDLRATLGEKFPNARHQLSDNAPRDPSPGLRADALDPGSITECSTASTPASYHCGHGLAIASLAAHPLAVPTPLPTMVLVDAGNCFDPSSFTHEQTQRLLWVRCQSTGESLAACDIVLRDPNLPLVVIDFSTLQPLELRNIPTSLWYRFRKLIEESGCAVVALTPVPMIPCATRRLTIATPHGIDHYNHDRASLLASPWLDTASAGQSSALRA